MTQKIDIVKTNKKIVSINKPALSTKKKIVSSKHIEHRKTKEISKQADEPKSLQLYSDKEKTMLMEMKPLIELTDKIPVLIKIIEEYENRKPVEAEVIELKLNTKELKGNQKAINVKIYERILNKLDKLTEKYSGIKKQDLISQFILEGIEKYGK